MEVTLVIITALLTPVMLTAWSKYYSAFKVSRAQYPEDLSLSGKQVHFSKFTGTVRAETAMLFLTMAWGLFLVPSLMLLLT